MGKYERENFPLINVHDGNGGNKLGKRNVGSKLSSHRKGMAPQLAITYRRNAHRQRAHQHGLPSRRCDTPNDVSW